MCSPALSRFHKLVYIKINFDRDFDHCKRWPQKSTMQIDILSLKLNIDHTADEHKYSLLVEFSIGTFLPANTLQKRAYGAELQISKR